MSRFPQRHSPRIMSPAFTLVELLVVIGVIIVMMTLMVPAFNSLTKARGVEAAAYDIAGIMERARNYAIANNTYVMVGIAEYDANTPESANAQPPGVGRVVLATVASKDGLLGADPSNVASTWNARYNNGANLVMVGRPSVMENMHLADLGASPNSGAMARQYVFPYLKFGSSDFKQALNPFSWPLGKAIGAGKYNFKYVMTFSPQGTPYNYSEDNPNIGRDWEFGVQQTNGNVAPKPPTDPNIGNHAVVSMNGVTGRTRIFRP